MLRFKSSCIALFLLSAPLLQGIAVGNTPDGLTNSEINPGFKFGEWWYLIVYSSDSGLNLLNAKFILGTDGVERIMKKNTVLLFGKYFKNIEKHGIKK